MTYLAIFIAGVLFASVIQPLILDIFETISIWFKVRQAKCGEQIQTINFRVAQMENSSQGSVRQIGFVVDDYEEEEEDYQDDT